MCRDILCERCEQPQCGEGTSEPVVVDVDNDDDPTRGELPLAVVMRQKDVFFSSLLTKIGDGDPLDEEDVRVLQSRFVTAAVAQNLCPGGVRLFYSNKDADAYNSSLVTGDASVVVSNADEIIVGHKSQNQYDNAKANLATMKLCDTGGVPARIYLCVGKPYMLTANVDVTDGLVNGAIGLLRYIQHHMEGNKVERLWLDFPSETAGRLARLKVAPLRAAFSEDRSLRDEMRRLRNHKLPTVCMQARQLMHKADATGQLSVAMLNVQSLNAHQLDVTSDNVLTRAHLLILCETWSARTVDLPGYRCAAHDKRGAQRAAGVAIYIQEIGHIALCTTRADLTTDDNSMDSSVDARHIGDICAVYTRLQCTPLLVVAVYVSPGHTHEAIKAFLRTRLSGHSKLLAQKKHSEGTHHTLADMPMIIAGDFNVNLRNGQNQWLPNFMSDFFGMSLASESEVPTTRFGTALDHVFQRGLKNVEVLKYASYFTVHRPLLCLVGNASADEGSHGDTHCASGASATVERDRASHSGVTGDG
ncbi:hypothetical protein MTO96_045648 [Rhipicephalus appendiculatus]